MGNRFNYVGVSSASAEVGPLARIEAAMLCGSPFGSDTLER